MGRNLLLSRSVFNGLRILGSKTFSTTKPYYADKHLTVEEAKSQKGQMTSSAVVVEMKNMSHNVKWLKLLVEDKKFSFKAGQWVDMYITGIDVVGGYSIACPPSILKKKGYIELAIKYSEHPPSYWIHTKCQPSDKVLLRVGGDFYFDPTVGVPADDVLLIGGGLGINPLYSMLCHVQDLNSYASGPYRGKVMLLHCARTLTDLIWKENIEQMSKENLNINCQFYTSREDRLPPEIKSGRIKLKDIQAAVQNMRLDRIKVLMCGPSAMIEDLERHCYASGITKEKICYEKWTWW